MPNVHTLEVAHRSNKLCINGFKGYIEAQGRKIDYDALGNKKLTKEEEFIYYGSNGPNKVKMGDLNYEELDNKLQSNMKKLGLSGDEAKDWIRKHG